MEDGQYELDENQEDFSNKEKENLFYPPEFETNRKKMKEFTLNTIHEKTTTTGLNTSEVPYVQEIVNNINNIKGIDGKVLPYPDIDEIPEVKIKNEEYLKSEVKSEVKISDYFNRINIDNNNRFYDRRYNLCNYCHVNNNNYYCHECRKNLCKKCNEDIDICGHKYPKVIDFGELSEKADIAKNNIHEIINKINIIFMKPKQEKPKEQLQKIYDENDLDIDQNKKEIDEALISYKKTDDIKLIERIIGANYINYFHYVNIFECEQYLKNRYDICCNKCCLKINYKDLRI